MTQTSTPANVADVEEALRDVVDPELGINVVDLGLVYGITVDGQNHAVIDMTLTSAACPLTDVIEDQTAAVPRGPRRVLPRQLGLDAAVGPRQDHRRRPRAAARPRLQHLIRDVLVTTRLVEVAPARLDGWLERFAANNPDGPQRVVGVARFDHDPLAVVLVRRGGYAVGVASGDRLTAHKVGTRYVQSRTAAGGWSQQRFARRRANQADELVGAARSTRCGCSPASGPAGVVLGGDKALVAAPARRRPAGRPARPAAPRALRPARPAARRAATRGRAGPGRAGHPRGVSRGSARSGVDGSERRLGA